jgi:Cytochrome b(C-terminal)/b6/petD
MTEKDFSAGMNSDARKAPIRVAFITRRTSPAVRVTDEPRVMTYPEALLRIAVALELLAIVLVGVSLLWNAPLEGLADPMHTPNPAKAPWYFLGLQELLHYFPPVVAGVLIPTLVIIALIIIPYFNINVQSEGLWLKDKRPRLWIAVAMVAVLLVFFAFYEVFVALVPTVLVALFLFLSAAWAPRGGGRFRTWLISKPLSFWIMTWFLFELVILTAVGIFFRGPGWSWVWPWRSY